MLAARGALPPSRAGWLPILFLILEPHYRSDFVLTYLKNINSDSLKFRSNIIFVLLKIKIFVLKIIVVFSVTLLINMYDDMIHLLSRFSYISSKESRARGRYRFGHRRSRNVLFIRPPL